MVPRRANGNCLADSARELELDGRRRGVSLAGRMRVSRAQLLAAGAQLRPRVDPTLSVVFGVSDQGHYDYRGSASYFQLNGFPYVLTAAHVFNRKPKPSHLFHGRGRDATFPLRSGWVEHPNGELDLAIMGTFASALRDADIRPMAFSEFVTCSFDDPTAIYYANGFPGAQTTYLPFLREFSITGNPLLSRAAPLPAAFDPAHHFAIEYPAETRPQGMSGMPVWNLRLNAVGSLDDWSPELASFAGVAHRWVEGSGVLIVTRVEVVRDFVPGAARHLIEKHGWRNGDDIVEK